MQNFNQQGFSWFMGVIESISDPECMGRVRVRAFGFHTEDKTLIPTEALPWAHVMMPVTSASISGVGQSPTGLLCGTWVMGFFRDGEDCQDPVIMGSLPSKSNVQNIRNEGFKDPMGIYPESHFIGLPDTPKQAYSAYEETVSYVSQKDTRVDKVETASPPKLTTVSIAESDSYYAAKTWSSLDVDNYVSPIYPNNKVLNTTSGTTIEIDDTPGATRISEFHHSGTHRVVTDKGDNTTTVTGSKYTVVFKDDNILIKGSANITIAGDCRQLVKGNYHLQVEGNYTEKIKGSKQTSIGLSEQIEIGQDRAYNVGGNLVGCINGNSTVTIQKNSAYTIVGNSDLDVTGDLTDSCMGNRTLLTMDDYTVTAMANSTQYISGTLSLQVDGALGITTDAPLTLIGSTINLN